jgi:hypothetical protein
MLPNNVRKATNGGALTPMTIVSNFWGGGILEFVELPWCYRAAPTAQVTFIYLHGLMILDTGRWPTMFTCPDGC